MSSALRILVFIFETSIEKGKNKKVFTDFFSFVVGTVTAGCCGDVTLQSATMATAYA